MSKLNGKRVLITGVSSGIGNALAKKCIQESAEVVGISRRETHLIGLNHLKLDLESNQSVEMLKQMDAFDIVVANAGRGNTRMPSEINETEINNMIKANVMTAVNTFLGTISAMQKRKAGQFVFVGSILGRIPYAPWRCAYSASKAALSALVCGWRMETEPIGIKVKMFNPGLTLTEFQATANPNEVAFANLNPKSKSFPSSQAQSADEIADLIIQCFESENQEFYSRNETAEWVANYYSELANGKDNISDLLMP